MSVPPVMKTGFNNVIDDSNDKLNIISTICLFTENALKTAALYVEHSKRNGITKKDIKKSLMLEVFLFGKRGNEFNEIIKIKQELQNAYDSDDDINELLDDNDIEPFKNSDCSCAMCKQLNNIEQVWNNFEPKTELDKIMKKHIDEMDNENSWFSDSDDSNFSDDSDTE